MGKAIIQMAAITPRRAPSDALSLKNHDLCARLGQLPCSRQPGEAATDNSDIISVLLTGPCVAPAKCGAVSCQ